VGDLDRDTAVTGADGAYRARLDPSWEIWGPFGGYVAAVALRAAGTHSQFDRPASFACHFLATARFAEVSIATSTLRVTRRAESVRVHIEQDGRPILEAVAWIVAAGDGLGHDAAPPPDVPGPDDVTPLDERLEQAGVPLRPVWQNLDERPLRWIEDWDTRIAGDPCMQAWCRFRPTATFTDPFLDAARALAVADASMWPAATHAYTGDMAYIAPSLDLAVQFHSEAPDSEWLLVEGRSPFAADGLVGGTASVWSCEGRLVATALQQMLCRPAPPMP
jgi:acyl-CoA thioesterase